MTDLFENLERAQHAFDDAGELPWQQRSVIRRLLTDASAWREVELASARHVLPVWSASYSEELPREVVDLGEHATRDPAGRERLEAARLELHALLDHHIYEANGDAVLIAAAIAGWAAACAAASVLGHNDNAPPNELDGDPYDWSASFAGSVAAAGGATWEVGVGSPELRRRYWQWWLDTAIPEAVSAVTSRSESGPTRRPAT